MPTKHETGRYGESLAAEHLLQKGWEILECNWRCGRAEIDIIAKDGDILVFVEVKTRSYTTFGKPEEFFTHAQQGRILDAAGEYMEQISHDWEIRFDLVSVVTDQKGDSITHFKDVFFPGITHYR
jgi:putative endonuclease